MMVKIWDLALDIPSISPEEPPSSTALVWAAALVLLAAYIWLLVRKGYVGETKSASSIEAAKVGVK